MKKPVIGILPLYDLELDSLWMIPYYLKRVKEAGGIPLVLSYNMDIEDIEELNKRIDGYIFPGGNDIDPSIYKAEKMPYCGKINEIRDNIESKVFKVAYESNKAILGVCRGSQIINSLLGGDLYQDLEMEFEGIEHHQEKPYTNAFHWVKVLEDTPISKYAKETKVNSLHHQGVKHLASTLKPMCLASDGLIEAYYAPEKKFLWAFQWHPEMLEGEELSQKIFEDFIEASRG